MTDDEAYINLHSPENVRVFDELPLWSAPFGLRLLEQVHLKKNITALDIGFGTGFPLTELAMRLGKSCTVFGIDPWEEAIARTEEKIRHYGISQAKIIRGVAEEIPLDDGSVNLIVSNNGINNVTDLNRVLAECNRVMAVKGQFVLSVNLEATMIEFYSVMEQVLSELDMRETIIKIKEHIYSKRRPLPELKSLLEQNGFAVRNIVEDQFEYRFTDGTTLFQHFFIRLAFLPSWKSMVPAEKQVRVFDRIEAKMNEQASLTGICSLSVPFVVINCEKTKTPYA
jgi:arsenite methyltransferase